MPSAPQDTPYKSKNSPSYYPPMAYEPSLGTCTSSPTGRDVGVENGNNAQTGFNTRGIITRGANPESDYKELDGLSKCTQRHACKHKDCGKSFTTSAHLSRHVKLHTGQRPHKCPLPGCKKEFARRDNMLVHYRTHAKKSGVEFGLTVVSARRASSGSIPQGCKHILNVPASIGRLDIGEDEASFPVMRTLQANREDSYSLDAQLYQHGDIGLVSNQQGALRVGQCHPYPSCQYAPPLVQGEGSDSSKSNNMPQMPLSSPSSPYDERVFSSQAYGGLHEVPMDVSMHEGLKLALQKYPRKQVCQQRRQDIGFSRQRSHSETPALCNPARARSGASYKHFHLHFPYPAIENGFLGHKIASQESEALATPAYFGTPKPQQKAQDAQAYYTGGKAALDHVNVNPNSADPMPALIKSLITGDNASSIEIKVKIQGRCGVALYRAFSLFLIS